MQLVLLLMAIANAQVNPVPTPAAVEQGLRAEDEATRAIRLEISTESLWYDPDQGRDIATCMVVEFSGGVASECSVRQSKPLEYREPGSWGYETGDWQTDGRLVAWRLGRLSSHVNGEHSSARFLGEVELDEGAADRILEEIRKTIPDRTVSSDH